MSIARVALDARGGRNFCYCETWWPSRLDGSAADSHASYTTERPEESQGTPTVPLNVIASAQYSARLCNTALGARDATLPQYEALP